MILYFADRGMNIVNLASNKNKNGLIIDNDDKVEDVDTGAVTLEFDLYYSKDNRDEAISAVEPGHYILKKTGDEYEFYVIITSDENMKDCSINVYAENEGLDLLNEVTGSGYTNNTTAYPIAKYVTDLIYDTGFEIGLNELGTTRTRTLQWQEGETCTAQLDTVANAFEAEISFSFEIKGLAVTKKIINIHNKRGGTDTAIVRVDSEVDNITIKKSVANLCNCYRVVGGTPEGSESAVTLKGYKYDDGDFFVGSDGWLYSRKSLERWSRYQWEKGLSNDHGYIVRNFTSSLTDQKSLFNSALSSLKKVCDIQTEYEIDISLLPENVRLGDTIDIVDENHKLYINARVLKLETKECDGTSKATLGSYRIKEYDISQKLQDLSANFVELAKKRQLYTWVAYADAADGRGISLSAEGKAYMGLSYNQLTPQGDDSVGDPSIYKFVKIKGDNGQPLYTWVKYADDGLGTNMSDAPEGKKYKGMSYNNEVKEPSSDPADYIWTEIKGEKGEKGDKGDQGEDGKDGDPGVGVKNVTKQYYLSSSNTELQNGSWSETQQVYELHKYYWSREKTEWTDGVITYSVPILEEGLNNANIKVTSVEASLGYFQKVTTEKLEANEASIGTLSADYATFKDTTTENLTATNTSITNLNADYAKFKETTTDTLTASSATINDLDSNVANIKTLLAGTVTAGSTQTIVLNANNTTIANALIKDAMIDSLSFSKISGIDINTTELNVHSDDGKSTWIDNTIKIADASRTRVQLGKDNEGDYNLYVWDKSGNLMFDALGLTDKGVTREVIDNDNVKANAGIKGSKLDIDSVVSSINGSTSTIKSSKVKFDDKNQTLDVVFNTMNTSISDAEKKIETNTTAISTANGNISTLITNTQNIQNGLNATDKNVTNLQNNYSSLSQTVSGLNSTVASHTSSISSIKSTADTANTNASNALSQIKTVSDKQTSLTQDLSGFKTTVSNTYTTKNEFNELSIGGRNLLKQTVRGNPRTQVVSNLSIKIGTGSDVGDTYFYLTTWKAISTSETYTLSCDASNVPSGCNWRFGVGDQTNSNFWFTVNKNGRIYATGKISRINSSNEILIDDYDGRPSTAPNIVLSNFKLELGNKATDWTPAPEDVDASITTVDNKFANYSTTSQMNSAISQSASSITSTVSQTYATKTENNAKVSKTEIISTINQTAESVKISASKIELTGQVTFSMLNSDTQTKINNASSNASSALSTANSASSTASTAKSTADSALSKANTAASDASTAKSTANSANSTADAAKSTADSVKNSLGNYQLKNIPDTRDTNQPPSWYFTNYPKQVVNEFKTASVIGITGLGTYCTLRTEVPWGDASGGYPKQFASIGGHYLWREGTSASAWSSWMDLATWCSANDKTLINGAKIYTGSISATQIASNAITADKIVAGAITTDKIAANAITAAKLNVTSLSAISANLGSVTAGNITLSKSSTEYIKISGDDKNITVLKSPYKTILSSGGIVSRCDTSGQIGRGVLEILGSRMSFCVGDMPEDTVGELSVDYDDEKFWIYNANFMNSGEQCYMFGVTTSYASD